MAKLWQIHRWPTAPFLSQLMLIMVLLVFGPWCFAIDVDSTVTALRLANTITGGHMPTTDPLFQQMVLKVQAGDVQGAASLAAQSRYFASYLARRLALQMQTPSLDASLGSDNDSTAFIISHFIGAGGTRPSLSTLWSENATYLANVNNNGVMTATHAADLHSDLINRMDWAASLVQVAGQTAVAQGSAPTRVAIPLKHVGGFTTLSDRANDNSFAMYGASAGTNLRMIEGIWQIATGLTLVDLESASAQAQEVPRFIPEYNPNFFQGQGQTACIACHGGGMSSLTHGYAAVADVFDFDSQNGFTFISAPTTSTMKSLGSDPNQRGNNSNCNLLKTPNAVCNPDSAGVDPNHGWNLALWSATGVLGTMGWSAPTSGQGLNALGIAIGQSRIVYEFFTKRVIDEICPLGGPLPSADIAQIAASANPYASPPGTDDLRTIVALVASHVSCR